MTKIFVIIGEIQHIYGAFEMYVGFIGSILPTRKEKCQQILSFYAVSVA
jgi:hypothetical protein